MISFRLDLPASVSESVLCHACKPTKNSKSIERNCPLGKKSLNSKSVLYSFFELKILNITFTRLGEACGAKLALLGFEGVV